MTSCRAAPEGSIEVGYPTISSGTDLIEGTLVWQGMVGDHHASVRSEGR